MNKVTTMSKVQKQTNGGTQNALKSRTISPIIKIETPQETIERLAKLSQLEYEMARKKEAEDLGVRASVLDAMIKQIREEKNNIRIVEDLKPWGEEVEIEQVLDEIEGFLLKHAILPKGTSPAIAVWTASTYLINAFRIFPRLIIHSPEKRCGKSTVLDIIDAFAQKSLLVSNISAAAIFRVIDGYQPTLIIDEADTSIAKADGEIIGILNSGHAKHRAKVIRVEGDNLEVKAFSTWSPMAFASIKPLQGTLMDRSIVIELRRKMKDEAVGRLKIDAQEQTQSIRQKLKRWANDHFDNVQNNQIEPPTCGNDRAVDNWIPIFTLAHQAGERWFKKIENSYKLLTSKEEEHTSQIMLLLDIKSIFDDLKAKEPPRDGLDEAIKRKPVRISSAELVEKLIALEERPWCEWKKGYPMTKNSLAKLLKAFRIESKQLRIFGNKMRGYELTQFEDAFNRYIP